MKSKILFYILAVIISALLLSTISCINKKWSIVRPSSGIESMTFYNIYGIHEDCGFFIFGYSFTGKESMFLGGHKVRTKTGYRVWDHKFEPDDNNELIEKKKIKVYHMVKDAKVLLDEHFGTILEIELAFRKNRIVYGGHLFVDIEDFGTDAWIENRYEADCLHFLEQYAGQLKDVPLDTVLMKVNKVDRKIEERIIL